MPDTSDAPVDVTLLPPEVAIRYYEIPDTLPEVLGSFNMRGLDNYKIAPRFNLTNDPLRKGSSGSGGAGVSYNAADVFNYLFSPTERNKIRNRRRAKAYKTYNIKIGR